MNNLHWSGALFELGLLISLIYLPYAINLIKNKIGFSIPIFIKIILAILFLWLTLTFTPSTPAYIWGVWVNILIKQQGYMREWMFYYHYETCHLVRRKPQSQSISFVPRLLLTLASRSSITCFRACLVQPAAGIFMHSRFDR